jgi:prepilin-type N-terminal cleavage/methylation domain-containing protein
MTRTQRQAGRLRRGLTMMEMMVSMSITTMLLAGVAGSFVSSANVVSANDAFFRASQAARVTLNQVVVECRRADAVQCSNTGTYDYIDVIRPVEVLETNEVFRRYRYDVANRQLTMTLRYADGTDGTPRVMVRNVAAATFGPPQMGVDSNNATVVQRLPISVTIGVGPNAITMTGSTSPRRAMKY